MELLPLFLATIPLLIALHKVEWGLWAFIFMIPGYALRVPVGPAEISMIEIAAVLLMPLLVVVVLRNLPTQSAPTLSVNRLSADQRAHPRPARRIVFGNFFASLVSAAASAFTGLSERMRELRLRSSTFLFLSTTLFIAGLFVSLTQSNDIMASLGIIRGWVLVPIVFAFLFGTWIKQSRISSRFFVSAFVMSGILVSIISPFLENAWGGGRLLGFYESPNYLAMYLAPLLPLIAWYAKKYWHRRFIGYIILGGFVSVLIAVLFSFSRGALLGIGSGLAVTLFFYGLASPLGGRPWIRRNWGASMFGVASLTALMIVVLEHVPILESLQGALHSRLGIWEAAYEMLSRSPLLGIGAGMFQTAFTVKKHFVLYPVPVEVALHPHNIFLATWLYGGLLGFVGFLGILFATGRGLYIKLTKKVGSDPTFYGALAISFVIILIHGMVDTTYWKNDLAFMWWILIAFLR